MSSELRHRVDEGWPFPFVRFTGVLAMATAPEVRSALLDVLAGQPEAVVVDVSALQVTEPTAVAVLRDVHRETALWPAAHLLLCDNRQTNGPATLPRDAADEPTHTPDHALWQSTGWQICNDSATILAELGVPHPGDRLSLAIDPQISAARRSRELVNEACAEWDLPELAGSACVVVTELVNNVVSHARTPMTVLLGRHTDGMSVAVRDGSVAEPSFTGAPAPTAYGGRGMLLIDSVANRWGSLTLHDGKVVWALLTDDPMPPERVTDRIG